MNKSELIDAVAASSGLTKADAKKAVDSYHEAITETLKKGEKVTVPGYGTYSVTERAERTGRNPQSGKEMIIPAKKVVKFKAGSNLADSVQ